MENPNHKHVDRREFIKYLGAAVITGATIFTGAKIAQGDKPFAPRPPKPPHHRRHRLAGIIFIKSINQAVLNIKTSVIVFIKGVINSSTTAIGILNVKSKVIFSGAINVVLSLAGSITGTITDNIWLILQENYVGTSYQDYNVVHGTTYQYRITDKNGIVTLSNIVTYN